ncbi:sigma-54-dependent Fis family transcriptional regulator [candidate division KSB1 bacterium]|nr:sigma-54-dependent Fis family transcriptional regulator [candidate division KSB1 bacterium]
MKTEKWGIVGTSEKILDVLDIIEKVAGTDVVILIQGESGTGKEIVARAIHDNSHRVSGEMVSVNCGAIPEGILESEIFGHEKGSFTGAVSQRKGYFEMADNGTIFLDEIAEMSLRTQVKLLRVLESGEFIRVGGTRAMNSNARILAATNKLLDQEVQKGNFREDLYYRLKMVTIDLPPLRDRGGDIDLLVEKFVDLLEKKYGMIQEKISEEILGLFRNYSWPGNIRELKNLLESLVLLNKGKKIEVSDLPESIRNSHAGVSGLPVYVNKTADQAERELIYRALLGVRADISDLKSMILDTMKMVRRKSDVSTLYDQPIKDISELIDVSGESFDDISVEKAESDLIQEALRRFNGNRRLAARALGFSERTLYRKLGKL